LSFSWKELGGQSTFCNYGTKNELEESQDGYLIGNYYFTEDTFDPEFD